MGWFGAFWSQFSEPMSQKWQSGLVSGSGQQGEAQHLEGEFTNEHGININILGVLHFSSLRLSQGDTGATEAGVFDDVTKSFEEFSSAVRATLFDQPRTILR